MKATLLSIGAFATLLLCGCSQEAKEDMSKAGDSASNAAAHTGDAVKDDTKAATETLKDAGAKTVDAATDAGKAIKNTADNAGAAVKEGAEKAGATAVAAGTAAVKATKDVAANSADAAFSAKVKSALLNSAGLETKNIDVDTVGKTVTLKGTVPDAKQKKQAEMAAKATAGTEYKVDDQLTVGTK